jgi:hypothetical protein
VRKEIELQHRWRSQFAEAAVQRHRRRLELHQVQQVALLRVLLLRHLFCPRRRIKKQLIRWDQKVNWPANWPSVLVHKWQQQL